MTLKKITNIVILIIVVTIFSSCNRNMKSSKFAEKGLLDEEIIIPNINCKETILQGIDSKVGSIKCEDVQLSYDYGRYSNKGPNSLFDSFQNTFKSYHYSNFFRIIGMDEKAYQSLKSRVKIIEAIPMVSFSDQTIIECKTCNAVAKLYFENKVFNYPYQENNDLVVSASQYQFDYFEENGWLYKRYKSLNDDKTIGLYVRAIDTKLHADALSILYMSDKDVQNAFDLIKSIRMKKSIIKNESNR